jgi:single-strand DNA-binding protein
MMLPLITGEFGVVADPEIRFSGNGKAWMSLRLVAKDRVRSESGDWADGDPMWINAVVFGKFAEHLADSVGKGDTVILTGRLAPNVWTDKEGVQRNDVQIKVDEIGVSMRWGIARTERYLETNGTSSPIQGGASVAAAALGATEIEQPFEAPF